MNASDWNSIAYPWEEGDAIRIAPVVVYHDAVSMLSAEYTHPYYTWWWLESGSLRLEAAGETNVIGPQHSIFIPSGLRRAHHFAPGSRLISINFFAHWPHGLPVLSLPHPVFGEGAAAVALRRLALRVCAVLKRSRSQERLLHRRAWSLADLLDLKAAMIRFVNQLFGELARHGGVVTTLRPGDARLAYVLGEIQTHLRAGPLPFEAWRRETGLGRSQLENLGRKHLQMTLAAYRNQLLMAEACRRLVAPCGSVKEIAAALGFVDSSHFCRWLRQQTGRTPGDFQNLQLLGVDQQIGHPR